MSNYFDFEDGRGLVAYNLHANGGGKVALTAQVDETVFLDAACVVFGKARIKGDVRITGRVRISGESYPKGLSTLIEDEVQISGNVKISGCVLLRDKADIRDNVVLSGCVNVMHRARIHGNAHLDGWVSVMDSAYLCGDVKIQGISEELVIRGTTYLREGQIVKDSELFSATKKDQFKQDGIARKRTAKT